MYSSNALNVYQQNSVNTASKEKLMLMLFEGLVKFIKQAMAGVEEKDIQKSNTNFIKAQNIVSEFRCTLDFEAGGELSKTLDALYEYMNRRLMEANISKDVETAKEVLGFAEQLKDTFYQAYQLTKQK